MNKGKVGVRREGAGNDFPAQLAQASHCQGLTAPLYIEPAAI